ncbi:MAG: ABC transporter ATP-binding protein/permease [Lachnospiraceae bacterium]|nr:ABC transporter ATP-binding protein/permease [Lachnospiraceae bacterium]
MQLSILKRILTYAKPYKPSVFVSFITALFSVFFSLLIPIIIGNIINGIVGVNKVDFSAILFHLRLLIAAFSLSALFQWIMLTTTRRLSALISQNIRKSAFDQINILPLKYIDAGSHGDFIGRLVNDADTIGEGLFQSLTQFFPGLTTIIGTLAIILWLDPVIALIIIVMTPLSILFAHFLAKRTNHFFLQQSHLQGELSGYINEMVTNKNIVYAFHYQKRCLEHFRQINQDFREIGFKAIFYSSVINPGTRFVNALIYVVICVIGAMMIIQGNLSLGVLTALLAYANQYTRPFNDVTGVLVFLQAALASGKRLFHLIDEHGEKDESIQENTLALGNISIENISFCYEPERPLIQNLNLNVKTGQRIAIVGPTGCGKTTLINLLMRFYDVNKGDIKLNGLSIYQMSRSHLRHHFGMVLQNTWLKNVSIKENIAYGKDDATLNEIIDAAKKSHAHDFITRLKHGYDTIITPNGDNLSVGEKQLLCITRIMLIQPTILILDEATSNLDTRTEMLIQQAFDALMEGRTSFIVAHRLRTIQSADVIVVMEQGQIVEQGKHEELLARKGAYYLLYTSGL